jgi:hypothetical protein
VPRYGGTRPATRPWMVGGPRAASTPPRPAACSTSRAPSTCARPTAPPLGRLAHRPGRDAGQPRATPDALIAASQDPSGTAEALRKVERTLPDRQRKLARDRATLDAGDIKPTSRTCCGSTPPTNSKNAPALATDVAPCIIGLPLCRLPSLTQRRPAGRDSLTNPGISAVRSSAGWGDAPGFGERRGPARTRPPARPGLQGCSTDCSARLPVPTHGR